jgi:hypothetical protein
LFDLDVVAPASTILYARGADFIAATAAVNILGGADLLGPCAIPVAIGLRLAALSSAICLDLSIPAAVCRSLAAFSPAICLCLPVAATALGAGLLATAAVGFLRLGGTVFVATPSAAAFGGRRGCDRQRRCAGSKHPLHHGISPLKGKTAKKGARSAV